jgi:hypothetical protein
MHILLMLAMMATTIETTLLEDNSKLEEICLNAEALKNADGICVNYMFGTLDDPLEIPFKEELVRNLQEIGIVFPADDTLLTKEQLQEKYGSLPPMMYITAFPRYEDVPDHSLTDGKLHVLEIGVEIKRGEDDSEDDRFRGIAWEKQKFISTQCEKKEYIHKAVKNLRSILNDFKKAYQIANPPENEKKPHFFLYEE